MANTREPRAPMQETSNKGIPGEHRLLWNPENVRDVAESVGIATLSEEALRTLSQDVEYRIGQVLAEATRFMRLGKRTSMTVRDVSLALRVLDVEPLYGYDATKPLRYGEATMGQPFFYIEDEEADFERVINGALPKVSRDGNYTVHWLAIEGVQPTVPQNPTSTEARSQDLLPKGPGANPALAALSGHDNPNFRPSVKHAVSQEQILFFEKVQAALLDDNPDPEVHRLRQAALAAVVAEPGTHQLMPYYVTFISNQVTHYLDDLFVLRQMMELTNALISNAYIFVDPYASALCAPVLTCLLGRRLGSESGSDAVKEQYQLREVAASLIGQLASKYSLSNKLLRPKLTRSCLKAFLNPTMPPQVWYGAILGILAAGGREAIKVLVLPNLNAFDSTMLQPLRERGEASRVDFEMVVGGILKAAQALADEDMMMDGVNGDTSDREAAQVREFLGDIIGERVIRLGDHRVNQAVLDAMNFQ
ncbi:putative transcription initiation factor TFIID subunit 6 [Rosellinia necatrix]|uniref:TBP-associated factor 6 n=1 Tax=Rosellinia necatrix TaxID=77044 RepID=A0A1W2TS85_ROSNE|nr:putative transcription initiation factor TFIID subunit 6 [Rosellinia necatrix]